MDVTEWVDGDEFYVFLSPLVAISFSFQFFTHPLHILPIYPLFLPPLSQPSSTNFTPPPQPFIVFTHLLSCPHCHASPIILSPFHPSTIIPILYPYPIISCLHFNPSPLMPPFLTQSLSPPPFFPPSIMPPPISTHPPHTFPIFTHPPLMPPLPSSPIPLSCPLSHLHPSPSHPPLSLLFSPTPQGAGNRRTSG